MISLIKRKRQYSSILDFILTVLLKVVKYLANKGENKSFYLYTALIFMVAILMIVISFFSQINLDKQHNEVTGDESAGSSIAEKTSQLSDENMILLETNKALNDQNSELTSKNWDLNEQISQLEVKLSNADILCETVNEIESGDLTKASETLEKLDTTALTQEQQKLYDNLKTKLEK